MINVGDDAEIPYVRDVHLVTRPNAVPPAQCSPLLCPADAAEKIVSKSGMGRENAEVERASRRSSIRGFQPVLAGRRPEPVIGKRRPRSKALDLSRRIQEGFKACEPVGCAQPSCRA